MDRTEKMCTVLKLYADVTPLLKKMENVVLGTSCGRSPKMEHYYEYWETQIYYGLILMTRNNLRKFIKDLNSKTPIFQVDAVLSIPEIALRPSPTEILTVTLRNVKNFTNR